MADNYTINQDKQFVPNKKTPVSIVSALNNLKKIYAWEDEEKKGGALTFLGKVFTNIRKNPNNEKFRDLNITKIRKLTRKWQSIPMLILFNAGFEEERLKGQRMTLDLRNMTEFNAVASLFENTQKFDPTKEPEIPKPVKKPEPEKMDVEEKPAEGEDKMDVEDGEPKKEEKKTSEMTEEEIDDDLDDLLKAIKAEKAKKGIDTLKMDELKGLTKEEKMKLLDEKREKYRKKKDENARNEAYDKAARQREAIKAQADMQRKREEHQAKMIIQQKKRQREEDKRRKAQAREKIRKQKEERRKAAERRRKEKEAKQQTGV